MKYRYISLRRKLLVIVLMMSTAVTSLVFLLTLIYDYNTESNHLDEVVERIQLTTVKPLALSIWNFNNPQTESILKSILNQSEITGVNLVVFDDGNKDKITQELKISDKDQKSLNKWKVIEVFYEDANQPLLMAHLKVQIDSDGLFIKIIKKSSYFLFLQSLKTFALSFFLLWIFQHVVTSKIEKLISDLRTLELKNRNTRKRLRVDASFNIDDEFNDLVKVINNLTYKTAKFNELTNLKLQEAEEQIKIEQLKSIQSSKMAALGEMASGIAHEVNNPLAVIQAKVYQLKALAQKGPVEGQTLEKHFDVLLKTISRISKIIKGLKRFSRNAEADPFEEYKASELISDSLSLCEQKVVNQGVQLTVELVEDFTFECRSTEISQVLINLISNSADAIQGLNEKWIKIKVFKNDDKCQISVTDSGKGIPKEIAEKIMLPFFSTKEVGKGTGLGLSISKAIIEQHNGKFYLNSSSANTQFVVELPLVQQKRQSQAQGNVA